MFLQAPLLNLSDLFYFAFDAILILSLLGISLDSLNIQGFFHLRGEFLLLSLCLALLVFVCCEKSWLPLFMHLKHISLLLLDILRDLLNINSISCFACINKRAKHLQDPLHLYILAKLTMCLHCFLAQRTFFLAIE